MKILHIPTGQICYWTFETQALYNCIVTGEHIKKYAFPQQDPRKIEISSAEFDRLCKQHKLVICINDETFINNYMSDTQKSLDLLEFTLIE